MTWLLATKLGFGVTYVLFVIAAMNAGSNADDSDEALAQRLLDGDMGHDPRQRAQ